MDAPGIPADDPVALEALRGAYVTIREQLRRYPGPMVTEPGEVATSDRPVAALHLEQALDNLNDAVKAIRAQV